MRSRILLLVSVALTLACSAAPWDTSGETDTSEQQSALEEEPAGDETDPHDPEPTVIYGPDGRQEVMQMPKRYGTLADGVVALFPSTDVRVDYPSPGKTTVRTHPYKNIFQGIELCPEERFIDQPSSPICTGVLVAPKLIATAKHCLDMYNVSKAVFGFKLAATGAPDTFFNSEVYSLVPAARGVSDWVLLELDRAVPNHRVLPVRRRNMVPVGQPLSFIGHPFGLPAKVVTGVRVLAGGDLNMFKANLDGGPGASGGPLFNQTNSDVEGLTGGGVRLEDNFVEDPSRRCLLTRKCADDGSDCGSIDSERLPTLEAKIPGSSGTYFADVNGDGKDDAIAVNFAKITVRTSTGSGFGGPVHWTDDPFYGARGTYFADVNHDNCDDAIALNANKVLVRLSNCVGKFNPATAWYAAPLIGSRGTYFADVTGDGAADAIVVGEGAVRVRPSNRVNAFSSTATAWITGAYYGTRGTFFADVTGDNKADAIVVNNDGITVRRALANSFGGNEPGVTGAFWGSRGTFFADVTGDRKADAIAVNDDGITVRRATDQPKRFSETPEVWAGAYYGERGNYFANVNGIDEAFNTRADAIVVRDTDIVVRTATATGFRENWTWLAQPFYGDVGRTLADQ